MAASAAGASSATRRRTSASTRRRARPAASARARRGRRPRRPRRAAPTRARRARTGRARRSASGAAPEAPRGSGLRHRRSGGRRVSDGRHPLRERLPAVAAGGQQPVRLEELPRRLVALGGDEADAHPRLGARERELAHLREHPRLDAAPERAAAHQQVVELERVGRLTHERDADKPIVAVPVGDVRDARLEPGGERGEVVKLNWLVFCVSWSTRASWSGDRGRWRPAARARRRTRQVGRGGGDRPALQLGASPPSSSRPPLSLSVERPQVGDERVLQGRLRRQQHGARAGARATVFSIAVDEDNRLQLGEPELGRRRGDVGALGLPVLLVQHEVVVRERPLGVRRRARGRPTARSCCR